MFRRRSSLRRRKRGNDEKTAVQAPAIAVELCQLVDAGAGERLLRVAGRWTPEPPDAIDLVAFGDGTIERINPLAPGPGLSSDGLWRAAFAVGAATADAHLALITGDGTAVGLPSPDHPPSPGQERDEEERLLAEALEDLADSRAVVEQLRSRCELSERTVAELREQVVASWDESSSLRELLDRRETAHEAARQRARRADAAVAEERAQHAARGLTARRSELEAQCARLEAQLAERTTAADVEELRAEAAASLERFQAARAEADALRSELASARSYAEQAAETSARATHEIRDEYDRAEAAEAQLAALREQLASGVAEGPAAESAHGGATGDWPRVDEEMLARIARAKDLAGQD